MSNIVWLADALRTGGCKVVEHDGWETRGHGQMGNVRGVLCHHTGPTASLDAAVNLIEKGRADLAGPLSHLVLDVDGTFHVTAAGLCYHAGAGSWHGVTNGNHELIGIEARNRGDGSAWPVDQVDNYERGCAAILDHIGADSVMAAGHKEYALPRGRKIDPTLDMVHFREDVGARMAGTIVPIRPVAVVDPTRAMLRKGDQGNSVRQLQTALGIHVDGAFGPATEAAVKAFQTTHGLTVDGLAGPATWKALGQ